MKLTLKLLLTSIRRSLREWFRKNIIDEGWEDSRGFHYGRRPQDSSK